MAHGLPLLHRVLQVDGLFDTVEISHYPHSVVTDDMFATVIVARPIVDNNAILAVPLAQPLDVPVILGCFAFTRVT
jgi:hypothetical protein